MHRSAAWYRVRAVCSRQTQSSALARALLEATGCVTVTCGRNLKTCSSGCTRFSIDCNKCTQNLPRRQSLRTGSSVRWAPIHRLSSSESRRKRCSHSCPQTIPTDRQLLLGRRRAHSRRHAAREDDENIRGTSAGQLLQRTSRGNKFRTVRFTRSQSRATSLQTRSPRLAAATRGDRRTSAVGGFAFA